jgi:hypothetical protein
MGCGLSKPQKANTGSTLGADFDPNAKIGGLDSHFPFALRGAELGEPTNADTLPNYTEFKTPQSIKSILYMIKVASEMTYYGVKGAFTILGQRHYIVWVDDNNNMHHTTKRAILFMTTILLLLAKAFDCNMTFFFAGTCNMESPGLSQEGRAKLQALQDLWTVQHWRDAVEQVDSSKILISLGIRDWIYNKFSKTSKKSDNIISDETDDEKLTLLLEHIRDLKLPYWHGYHQRELKDKDSFRELYISALKNSTRQPKNLNNLRFTYQRTMGLYARLKTKSGQTQPTTVLILTGSPLQPTEVHQIQEYQREGGRGKNKIMGQGTEFCIETMVFAERMNEQEIGRFKELDDFEKGENDIQDTIILRDSLMVSHGPGARLLLKVFNAQDSNIDHMNLKEQEKYGESRLNPGVERPELPSVEQIKVALGLDNDDI